MRPKLVQIRHVFMQNYIIEFARYVQQFKFSQVYPQAETKPEFQQTKSLDFDSKGKNGKLKIFHFSIAVFSFFCTCFLCANHI